MSGDYSRDSFDPNKDYNMVRKQQGRIDLDADWNEAADIQDRRWRAETLDLIGRTGVPETTPDAFEITFIKDHLFLGIGRIYIDGLQVENHGTKPSFDPVLAELYGTQACRLEIPAHQSSVYLAYLEVWQREVDALQDPALIDPAVGVDTTTRTKIEWKVRFLPLPDGKVLPENGCDRTLWETEQSWKEICAPSRGRLTVTTTDVPQQENPCDQPPSGGYRGRENQLYRVEIHDVLDDGTARFKWSRENASVATAVTEVVNNDEIRVASLGRDDVLCFQQGDWVEILSDDDELAADAIRSGFMARITERPSGNTLKLHLPDSYSDALAVWKENPGQIPTKHLRLRRWDQKPGPEKSGSYKLGLIPRGTEEPVDLEAGIQVQFGVQNGGDGPAFRPGDYWVFPARTADPSSAKLAEAPPAGIHRHYCPLALVDLKNGHVRDCRVKFPSLTDTLSLFYLGGDGQEVEITNEHGTPLPAALRVGAARGRFSVPGMKVRFETTYGKDADSQLSSPEVTTDQQGVAECQWTLKKVGKHTAKASLIDDHENTLHLPIEFTAVGKASTQCMISVSPEQGRELHVILNEMQRGGINDFCLCLAAKVYSGFELDLDADWIVRTDPVRRPILRITGCGGATRIRLPRPCTLKNWSSVTFSDLMIDGPPPAPGQNGSLLFDGCTNVTLERCNISGSTGEQGIAPVVTIASARQAVIKQCHIEAQGAKALHRLRRMFSGSTSTHSLPSLRAIFATPSRVEFEGLLTDSSSTLSEKAFPLQALPILQSSIRDWGHSFQHVFSRGERHALKKLICVLGSASYNLDDIYDSLRALRLAALKADPTVALVLRPAIPIETGDDAQLGLPFEGGDQRYQITGNSIVGVLALNGVPSAERPGEKSLLPCRQYFDGSFWS